MLVTRAGSLPGHLETEPAHTPHFAAPEAGGELMGDVLSAVWPEVVRCRA
jgi:hypothetical protein